jgi:hypothetical protein
MASRRRKRSEKKEGECVYCGLVGKLTDDHVPPENLFSKPLPDNLIKVPSCFKCNNGCSKDDEYFRLMLIMREDVGSHPEYDRLWPSVYRSLTRPQAEGFKTALLQNMAFTGVQTVSGLYLGRLPTYHVDLERLDRVAARVAKGLFFHELGYRLPDDYCAVSYNKAGIGGNAARLRVAEAICKKLLTSELKTVGAGVFAYRFQRTTDDPFGSACLMTFFGRVSFLCMTVAKTVAAKQKYHFDPNPVIIM